MAIIRIRFITLCWLALFPAACAPKPEIGGSSAPIDPVANERREKDAAFKNGADSPLIDKDRAGFSGLAYYPIDPSLRFEVKLNRHPVPGKVRIATNTGEIRDALRYGWFEFEVQGTGCRLQVYRMEEGGAGGRPSLFVPFRDATSGKETYAAGRYIDLPENTTGIYSLDLNRAYNPYCAYGKDYSCPVPPPENTLPVPVRAGEKSFQRVS
jgi:uncharacterized protein (DUF1684 family)